MTSGNVVLIERQRSGLIHALFPSVVSGIILGVIGAAVAGVIVNAATYNPNSHSGNQDATISAVYVGWLLFFFLGIGAFNGVWNWGFARREPTPAEEQELAGKGQGLWRYFRYTTDHKVVGMQYLATVFVLFFVGSIGAFMIRLEQSTPGAIFTHPPLITPLWACMAS
jgi:cytochrome c oxidase subunit I